ncbi:MAG TPA: hypothetical protein VNA69_04150 [Thermoanaerobaculia bacterium]|nr:hypothetical protein [Thermoanaerobaculia bacterium]
MKKHVLPLLVMLVAVVALQGEPVRVQLKQQGRSGIVVNYLDCDGDAVRTLPKDLSIQVSATDAYVRPFSNTPQQWRRRSEPSRAHQGDQYEIRSTSPWWPEETTIRATVHDAAGQLIDDETLENILPRAPAWFGFVIAMAGAVAAAIVRIGFARKRSLSSILYGAFGVLFAAALAWTAVETKEVWNFFGFEKPPLRSQSYLLLGMALGAFDPQKLIKKLTRQAEEEPLTARDVHDRITGLLTAENIRKPFREELEEMLFDQKYISEHPKVIGRLEGALEAAKNKVNLPKDLSNYLAPRLTRMYLGSYRRNFRLTMNATIDAAAGLIAWKRRTYYEFVRNDALAQTGPEVTSSVITTIPQKLRNQSAASFEKFGTVLKAIRLSIRDFTGGPSLTFEGREATRLVPVDQADGSVVPPPIDVTFKYHPEEHSVEAVFKYAFPDAFQRMPVVSVDIEKEFISELEDGLSFLRVAQPTFGYSVQTNFTPSLPHPYEIAVFEWTEVGRNTSKYDSKEGSAQLTGWLMPGNGLCIAWYGTKDAVAGVAKTSPKPPESMAQRMLRFLPWRKR